jgi:hypothetical protein
MNGDRDAEGLAYRSLLPDPCTLLFGVPYEAPQPNDAGGRQWSVTHWVHCARRVGHAAVPMGRGGGIPRATYCGHIDLDGLIYQVHRGPRKRILMQYVQADGSTAERFELDESVWVEPVAPEPLPDDCPWCDLGPPSTFRYAAEADGDDGVYVIGVSEHPDGAGRVITIQLDLDEPGEQDIGLGHDTYCLVLDPGQHTIYGGITECVIEKQTLRLRLTPDAARDLGVDPSLRFDLDLAHDQLALLRAGLRRTLSAGRADARPIRLQV